MTPTKLMGPYTITASSEDNVLVIDGEETDVGSTNEAKFDVGIDLQGEDPESAVEGATITISAEA